eukprot:COSAG01_NODE_8380_length_2807_cov_3.481905_2_plen_183_part_00
MTRHKYQTSRCNLQVQHSPQQLHSPVLATASQQFSRLQNTDNTCYSPTSTADTTRKESRRDTTLHFYTSGTTCPTVPTTQLAHRHYHRCNVADDTTTSAPAAATPEIYVYSRHSTWSPEFNNTDTHQKHCDRDRLSIRATAITPHSAYLSAVGHAIVSAPTSVYQQGNPLPTPVSPVGSTGF